MMIVSGHLLLMAVHVIFSAARQMFTTSRGEPEEMM